MLNQTVNIDGINIKNKLKSRNIDNITSKT